jgi:hypothetical protein
MEYYVNMKLGPMLTIANPLNNTVLHRNDPPNQNYLFFLFCATEPTNYKCNQKVYLGQ